MVSHDYVLEVNGKNPSSVMQTQFVSFHFAQSLAVLIDCKRQSNIETIILSNPFEFKIYVHLLR